MQFDSFRAISPFHLDQMTFNGIFSFVDRRHQRPAPCTCASTGDRKQPLILIALLFHLLLG